MSDALIKQYNCTTQVLPWLDRQLHFSRERHSGLLWQAVAELWVCECECVQLHLCSRLLRRPLSQHLLHLQSWAKQEKKKKNQKQNRRKKKKKTEKKQKKNKKHNIEKQKKNKTREAENIVHAPIVLCPCSTCEKLTPYQEIIQWLCFCEFVLYNKSPFVIGGRDKGMEIENEIQKRTRLFKKKNKKKTEFQLFQLGCHWVPFKHPTYQTS